MKWESLLTSQSVFYCQILAASNHTSQPEENIFWFEICFACYIWFMFWYTWSSKSEGCPWFSGSCSFRALTWRSCSQVWSTRCFPCHFGTTWDRCARARWCTISKRKRHYLLQVRILTMSNAAHPLARKNNRSIL